MAYNNNNGNFGYGTNYNNGNYNNANFGYSNVGNNAGYTYNTLPGRMVNNFNEITPQEIPMDTTPAVFVKNDMQEIQVKKWDNNGNIVPYTYRLVDNNGQNEPNFEQLLLQNVNRIVLMLENIAGINNNNIIADQNNVENINGKGLNANE